MKLYSKKNKLTSNLSEDIEGKLVIHKYTNAIFQVVDTNLINEDLRLKVQLIHNPCNYRLTATGGVVFSNYKGRSKGFWIEKYSFLKIFNSGEDDDDVFYNVVAEDLYLF